MYRRLLCFKHTKSLSFYFPAVGKFGDPCDEDVQCAAYLTGGICSDYVCGCSIGFHGYGVSCYRDAALDEFCTDKRECVFSEEMDSVVDCLEGVCTCLTQKSIDGRECLPSGTNSANKNLMGYRFILSMATSAYFLRSNIK